MLEKNSGDRLFVYFVHSFLIQSLLEFQDFKSHSKD